MTEPRPNRAIALDPGKCSQARTRKGLSRERLAEESKGGLSVATVKRLEKGDAVYLDTARRFAALLQVPLQELLSSSAAESAVSDLGNPAVIAVLRFDALTPDVDSRCFADGLVEDLISRFGRRWFPVIARASTFSYGEGHPEPAALHDELGADYAVEGSVRRAGDRLRVTARLTETRSARQVWASTYDREYADVFALQDELVSTIVGQMTGAIVEKEYRDQLRRDCADLSAWELAVRGSWHFHRRSKESNSEARSLFERALQRDPALPLAWYSLAMTHQRAIVNQWTPSPASSLHDMRQVCAEFSRLYPSDPGMHVASAYAAIYAGERHSALARIRDAIDLDPNVTIAYSLHGQILCMANQADEAIEQFELAIRLSPRDSDLWSIQSAVALCHFVAERYEDMLSWAQRAVQSRPDIPFSYGTLAVAKAYLGDLDEARGAVRSMLALEPQTSLKGLQALAASTNPDILARYVAGLRKADFPA